MDIATEMVLMCPYSPEFPYEGWVCVNNYGSHKREKRFIVEHYFRSFGVGRQNGPNLRYVREHYKKQFNKTAPSNKTVLPIVEKFHRTEPVLRQRKGTTGRPRTVTTNENQERLLQQVSQSPKRSLRRTSLKLGVSDRSVRQMFKELHLKRRYIFCVFATTPVHQHFQQSKGPLWTMW